MVTISDSRTAETDRSGPLVRQLLEREGHAVTEARLVPDDEDAVRGAILELLERREIEAVLLTGGTGIAPRDLTAKVLEGLLSTRMEGFGELFRSLSYREIGPAAMLSRAQAGFRDGKPVFSMPGSPAAVRLAMESLILPELGHVVAEAQRTT